MENQPFRPSMRALKPGASSVFMKVWPVLKSLPQIGHVAVAGQLEQGRDVGGQVRRAVGEGHAALQRGVGVDLAGRDLGIVLAAGPFRRPSSVWWTAGGLVEDLGGAAPDHHQARRAVGLLEVAGCRPSAPRPCPSWCPGLHVRAVEALHVVLVEDRLHGLDGLRAVPSPGRAVRFEHAGLAARLRRRCLRRCPSRRRPGRRGRRAARNP